MIAWVNWPLVVTVIARCPHCGSTATAHLIRTESNGDNSRTNKRVCRDCDKPFRELVEWVAENRQADDGPR